ncbi:DUF268 domain-containing protein [candidate division WOR-3 bacterium]|nr:DUF268 domain-containing protein [candidate division WOR-3 bacterium]
MNPNQVPSFEQIVNLCMHNRLYERSREYEFVLKYFMPLLVLPKELRRKIKVLDVGGAESKLSKWLSSQGFDTYVIEIREDDYGSAKFIRANILDYDFQENFFDIIVAISTVEHVGLPAYGQDKQDPDGDVKTMVKLRSWVKPGGLLLVTVPFGKPHHPPEFERVYDTVSLQFRIILPRLEVIEKRYYCYNPRDPHSFEECSLAKALLTDAVACLALRKI